MVSAALQEATGVARRHRLKGSIHRLHERLAGARPGLAQQALSLEKACSMRLKSGE
jgi:hypothetical protein